MGKNGFNDQAGYKRVNYGELPYLMLEAIGELKAANDTLRERIERLEKAAASGFRASFLALSSCSEGIICATARW